MAAPLAAVLVLPWRLRQKFEPASLILLPETVHRCDAWLLQLHKFTVAPFRFALLWTFKQKLVPASLIVPVAEKEHRYMSGTEC